MTSDRLVVARRLALGVPALLLAGAYISELGLGLYPCEMCWWQRYPHFLAVALAVVAFRLPPARLWVSLAGLAVLASGLIGGFHAGVEYGWWEGITGCATAVPDGGGSALDNILAAPLVRCDAAPWTLLGISLAGFNFLFSTGAGIAILALLTKERHR
ncbi:disulfide bond formation protein B [Altererythrobacter sp. H2]|uniref:disulfide bond formation protein B n=1 Tax=Altererythrobacter sp. H2 TaxID=3108391 RepID=UPI002B4BB641|nr:disulfide bond formation protein B [Altererythrobacter sp. H2]WRK96006.1 disulfide bond formation protein B [Altererythrobacter sp. H2]